LQKYNYQTTTTTTTTAGSNTCWSHISMRQEYKQKK